MPRVRSAAARTSRRLDYHLTCSNCRARKVKCDGGQPECGICQAYSDTCRYDKAPPMTQIRAMADRIFELEQTLSQNASSSETQKSSEPMQQLQPIDFAPLQEVLPSHTSNEPVERTQDSQYYQSTSAVQDPLPRPGVLTEQPPDLILQTVPDPMTAEQFSFWEEEGVRACAKQLQIPSPKVKHLLRTHWSWVQPAFLFVSPPMFLRDAACGGPKFSQLLLCVLCLHSTRFTDHGLSDEFEARVHLLLGHELQRSPSMPLIQALLLLSAREMGKGSLSQAWLYSGMAFRMSIDYGLFGRSARTSATDIQQTQRLAWSCYLWDKAISLYLGRAPALPERPDFDPPESSEFNEGDSWCPPDSNNNELPQLTAHLSSYFQNFCKLAVIINDLLLNVYGKNALSDMSSFIQKTRRRLESWRHESPLHLQVSSSTQRCPPPHILTQNLLYYTTIILLHRPFRANDQCKTVLRHASKQVEELLLLFERDLTFSRVSYMMAYCAYTAATVAVQDMDEGIAGSQRRINTYLRALYSIRASCPGIQQSIDIIIKRFDAETPTARPSQTGFEALPAFPFNFDANMNLFEGINHLPFGDLNAFPSEWTSIPDDMFMNAFI